MIHREPNALRNHEIEPRDRLAAGWEQVGPGGIPTQDERYLRRFQELLAEYEEVQEKMEQIQCCLHYPGRGFKKEAIRIVSIDMPDWKALVWLNVVLGRTRKSITRTYKSPCHQH